MYSSVDADVDLCSSYCECTVKWFSSLVYEGDPDSTIGGRITGSCVFTSRNLDRSRDGNGGVSVTCVFGEIAEPHGHGFWQYVPVHTFFGGSPSGYPPSLNRDSRLSIVSFPVGYGLFILPPRTHRPPPPPPPLRCYRFPLRGGRTTPAWQTTCVSSMRGNTRCSRPSHSRPRKIRTGEDVRNPSDGSMMPTHETHTHTHEATQRNQTDGGSERSMVSRKPNKNCTGKQTNGCQNVRANQKFEPFVFFRFSFCFGGPFRV